MSESTKEPMGLMPTCREVHRLASERLDRELSMVERARMQMHLVICGACRTFDGQMDLIRRAMRKVSDVDIHPSDKRE